MLEGNPSSLGKSGTREVRLGSMIYRQRLVKTLMKRMRPSQIIEMKLDLVYITSKESFRAYFDCTVGERMLKELNYKLEQTW